MIKSMTAFGSAELTFEVCTLSAEIRSYNSRYLDMILNIPYETRQFEEQIRQLISARVNRGRIEVRLRVEDDTEESGAFELDIDRARKYREAIDRLKDELNMDVSVSIEFLAGAGRIFKPVEQEKDPENLWDRIKACLVKAIDSLEDMRRKEGDTIATDLSMRLDMIESTVQQIAEISENLMPVYQEKLKSRIEELTKGIIDIDMDRVAEEAAYLADKSDISEEIVRAQSHIEQFRLIQHADEPGGRKLNFLMQEIGREINTIGSKTGKADVAHMVVTVKSELEKMREQIQNVE